MFFVANLHEGPDSRSQAWPSEAPLKRPEVMDAFQREQRVPPSDLLRGCEDCPAQAAREEQVHFSMGAFVPNPLVGQAELCGLVARAGAQ